MVQADPPDRVVDMVHQVGHAGLSRRVGRWGPEEGRHGGDLHQAAACPQRVQLLIVQPAWMRAQRGAGGVRRHDRGARQRRRPQHARFGDVADIDHQPARVHLGNGGLAQLRQPAMLGRRIAQCGAGPGAVRQVVVPVMRQRQVDGAQRPPQPDATQIVAHGVAVLHRAQHGGVAGSETGLQRIGRGAETGAGYRCARRDVAQHRLRPRTRCGMAGRVTPPLADIGDEDGGAHPARAHLRQVHQLSCLTGPVRRFRPADVDMRVEHQRVVVNGQAQAPRKRASSAPR